jgi:hypothetical protein
VALFYRAAQFSTVLSPANVCHCPRNLQHRIFLRLALGFHGTANSLSNDLNCSTTISTATRFQSSKSCLNYDPLSEAAKLPQIYMPFLRWLRYFEFNLHGMSSLLLDSNSSSFSKRPQKSFWHVKHVYLFPKLAGYKVKRSASQKSDKS